MPTVASRRAWIVALTLGVGGNVAARAQEIGGLNEGLPPLPVVRPIDERAIAPLAETAISRANAKFEVTLGQGRILHLPAGAEAAPSSVAVGDPSVADFTILSPRQLRVVGRRLGVTELSVLTGDDRSYTFEVSVVANLDLLRARLRASFPDASLKLSQLGDTFVVEGQARDDAMVARATEMIRSYLRSILAAESVSVEATGGAPTGPAAPAGPAGPGEGVPAPPQPQPAGGATGLPATPPPMGVSPEANGVGVNAPVPEPRLINLIRVPGSKQILLKVRIAELNRTGMRQIGANFLGIDTQTGAILGTNLGASSVSATANAAGRNLAGNALSAATASTTAFGIFQGGRFEFMLAALRRNSLLKILAEPNLIAMSGHQASFLAGGEYPIPVPQVGAGGVSPTITVQFKKFGVQLDFLPFLLDGDTIRLTVDPEVSQVDFAIATTLVSGGSPVPGLNTRRAHTTVELKQGQTLAIAGLMQLQMDGTTNRLPGLGDLPVLGPFFSNTTSQRIEKELVVLVTPYVVEALDKGEVPLGPGDLVDQPNDLEFYFLNRIEGRTGRDFRATTQYADPLHFRDLLHLEDRHVRGPHGFSD